MRPARYRFDSDGVVFGSGFAGVVFGSAIAQLLIPLIIWTIGHVVHEFFCADAAITTATAKPRTKIKGHFDGFLFICNIRS